MIQLCTDADSTTAQLPHISWNTWVLSTIGRTAWVLLRSIWTCERLCSRLRSWWLTCFRRYYYENLTRKLSVVVRIIDAYNLLRCPHKTDLEHVAHSACIMRVKQNRTRCLYDLLSLFQHRGWRGSCQFHGWKSLLQQSPRYRGCVAPLLVEDNTFICKEDLYIFNPVHDVDLPRGFVFRRRLRSHSTHNT